MTRGGYYPGRHIGGGRGYMYVSPPYTAYNKRPPIYRRNTQKALFTNVSTQIVSQIHESIKIRGIDPLPNSVVKAWYGMFHGFKIVLSF